MNNEKPIISLDHLIINPERPARADAVRNRELLLDTARRLFGAQGVSEVTMSELAKEAGVGKGTLYRHFNDKSAVCHALLDEAMHDFQTRTLAAMRQPHDPHQTLRAFLRSAVVYVVDHMDLLREAALTGGRPMLEHPAHFWWRQTIEGLLNRMNLTADTAFVTDMLYVMLDVRVVRYLQLTRGYEVQRIVDGLLDTLDRFTA